MKCQARRDLRRPLARKNASNDLLSTVDGETGTMMRVVHPSGPRVVVWRLQPDPDPGEQPPETSQLALSAQRAGVPELGYRDFQGYRRRDPGKPAGRHHHLLEGARLQACRRDPCLQYARTRNTWFQTAGLDDIWESYADSSELRVTKPDPEIHLAALTPLGVAPKDAAFVGHSQVEIDGAKAPGLTTIRFYPDPDGTVSDHRVERFADLLSIALIAEASA